MRRRMLANFALAVLFTLLPALTMASPAAAPSATTVDRAHSLINGDISVVDAGGLRMLVASAPQGTKIQGFLELKNHQRLIAPYTQIVSLITALHPSPSDAYNMGLGGGALAHFHLAQYPKSRVDSAEIDPAIIRLARKDFFVTNARHGILEGDGFLILTRRSRKYDVIWMDQFTPREGPKATVSAEDRAILRDHLKPAGFLIVHLGSARSSRTFSETIHDYRSAFRHGIHVSGEFAPEPILSSILGGPRNLPDHVIAVSDDKNLSCAGFWAVYKKWKKEKLVDIQLPEQDRASCEDLAE